MVGWAASDARAVTTFYDGSATIGNPISTYTGFGLLQNQENHASTALKWTLYFDDVNYTTETGSELQSFDTEAAAIAAGWTEFNSRAEENNFGYAGTNIAGGASLGEAGGVIHRSAPRGWYADTTIGTVDMATDNLFASGYMVLDGSAADNTVYLGWINPADPANTQRLGFVITEPNAAAGSAGARIAIGMSGAGGTQTEAQQVISNIANVPLYWELSYNASTGELSGLIREVPEPTMFGLCSAGGLWLVRRRTRAA
jgi:hypothetical protein